MDYKGQEEHFGDGIVSQSQAQEIWSYELETSKWMQWTENELDETDPYWGPDNRLWFASNKDGIFNVFYGYGGEVQQHTNVVGSVYGVDITQEGHVLYTDFTGHGFRIKMLANTKRKNDIVDYPGVLLGEDVEPSVRENTQKITEVPPESSIVEHSRSYESANGQLPFSLMPVVRTTDKMLRWELLLLG